MSLVKEVAAVVVVLAAGVAIDAGLSWLWLKWEVRKARSQEQP